MRIAEVDEAADPETISSVTRQGFGHRRGRRLALLVLTLALTLIPRIGISLSPSLNAEDFNKLRQAAIGNGTGKPLHSKVVETFGLTEKMPILVREIQHRGVGPNNLALESSIWFSTSTDEAFFVEQVKDAITIYHTDASRVLRAVAAGKDGIHDLHLISNDEASEGFETMLRLWAKNASRLGM